MKLWTKNLGLFTLTALVLLPFLALAQEAALPSEPGAIASAVIAAISGGQWKLVAALVVVGVIWVLRKFGASVWPFLGSPGGGALLAFTSGTALYLCGLVYAGIAVTPKMAIEGVLFAASAIGGWTGIRRILALIPLPWLQNLIGLESNSGTPT